MSNIQLKVRFPDEYLKYDDIESLWHYSIENSSNITVEFADLGFELIEIEEKLEDFKIKISNLDKKVSELIEFSKNLSNIWVSGEYETKLTVQKLLFPEGIVIDPEDRTYRTSNLNPIFGLIHSFTGGNDEANKKRTSSNTDPSCVVARAGLEPATFGL